MTLAHLRVSRFYAVLCRTELCWRQSYLVIATGEAELLQKTPLSSISFSSQHHYFIFVMLSYLACYLFHYVRMMLTNKWMGIDVVDGCHVSLCAM